MGGFPGLTVARFTMGLFRCDRMIGSHSHGTRPQHRVGAPAMHSDRSVSTAECWGCASLSVVGVSVRAMATIWIRVKIRLGIPMAQRMEAVIALELPLDVGIVCWHGP